MKQDRSIYKALRRLRAFFTVLDPPKNRFLEQADVSFHPLSASLQLLTGLMSDIKLLSDQTLEWIS